jgi:hypothetical protein
MIVVQVARTLGTEDTGKLNVSLTVNNNTLSADCLLSQLTESPLYLSLINQMSRGSVNQMSRGSVSNAQRA